ncbi:GNAT family N-acetyltransferase [uncultured Friedmanniella sp.]|uniref:GNAT family N-acetyltransferase n=1 Tax=uncultured Friedmanniella sp. TaxID=335381 RepID=UPI0035CB9CF2
MAPPTDTAATDASPVGHSFPDGVPVLVDAAAGVTLRPLAAADLPRVVEQCQDAEMIRWTTVPEPDGGYQLRHAEEFLTATAEGWETGERLGWVVEEGSRPGTFCGSVVLIRRETGVAEVGFGLHPDARGRHLMTTAVRLLRDHAFDTLGLRALRWRASVGNWGSRRVAAATGFVVEGAVRLLLEQRGGLHDGWVATLTADDPRSPVAWLDAPRLSGSGLVLRPFTESDVPRIVGACSDPRTQHWLVSLPRRYSVADALGYVEATREAAARATGVAWCVADADDDRCLGSVSLEGFGGYHRRAEIGYWSHPDARGRGLTTAAVRLVTAYAEAGLVDSLLIRVAGSNDASAHVARAAGYREVGVLPHAEPLGDSTVDSLVLYARP